jgi:hypothetical protein
LTLMSSSSSVFRSFYLQHCQNSRKQWTTRISGHRINLSRAGQQYFGSEHKNSPLHFLFFINFKSKQHTYFFSSSLSKTDGRGSGNSSKSKNVVWHTGINFYHLHLQV